MEAFRNSRLADIVDISGEEAGLHFLLTIRTQVPETEVMERAEARGIKLVPLSKYYYGESGMENVYVMNYSSVDVGKAGEIAERIYKSSV